MGVRWVGMSALSTGFGIAPTNDDSRWCRLIRVFVLDVGPPPKRHTRHSRSVSIRRLRCGGGSGGLEGRRMVVFFSYSRGLLRMAPSDAGAMKKTIYDLDIAELESLTFRVKARSNGA